VIAVPSKPIIVTGSNIINGASTQTEWVAGTYAKNDIVKVTEQNGVYIGYMFQSLIDNNTINPTAASPKEWRPIAVLEYDSARIYKNGDKATNNTLNNVYLSMEDNNDTDPTANDSKWQFLYKTNEYAFSDYYFTTTTEVFNQNLVLDLEFDRSDHISFFGVYGSTMTIEEKDENGNVLKTTSVSRVTMTSIVDYPTYLQFEGCDQKNYYMQELLRVDTHYITITLEPTAYTPSNANVAEISTIVVGTQQRVGCTLSGMKISRVAISPVTYDKWGDVSLSGDSYVKLYTATMRFDMFSLDAMDATLDKIFNIPTLFIFDESFTYDSLVTFGIMETADIDVDTAKASGVPLRVKSFKHKKNIKEC